MKRNPNQRLPHVFTTTKRGSVGRVELDSPPQLGNIYLEPVRSFNCEHEEGVSVILPSGNVLTIAW